MAYSIGEDGTIHRSPDEYNYSQSVEDQDSHSGCGLSILKLIIAFIVCYAIGSFLRNHLIEVKHLATLEQTESKINWTGTYRANESKVSTSVGTPVAYNITIRLDPTDHTFKKYMGIIEVSGYKTDFCYAVTAKSSNNALEIRSGHHINGGTGKIKEDIPLATVYFDKSDKSISTQWHSAMRRTYVRTSTKLFRISN